MKATELSTLPTLSKWFRERRNRVLRDLIRSLQRPGQPIRILDLGGRRQFWRNVGNQFLNQYDVHVTILNLTQSEIGTGASDADRIRVELGNACAAPYADRSFDLVVSNSVIEHLETLANMTSFAGETRRIAPAYYCQTPNFWFPIEPHFYKVPLFHWLPRPTRAWLLRTFPVATAGRASSVLRSYQIVDDARLLSKTQLAALFPDAELIPERFSLLFVKSWICIRRPAAAN